MRVYDLIEDLKKYQDDALVHVRDQNGDFVIADEALTCIDFKEGDAPMAGVLIV